MPNDWRTSCGVRLTTLRARRRLAFGLIYATKASAHVLGGMRRPLPIAIVSSNSWTGRIVTG